MFFKLRADWIYCLLLPSPFLASEFIDTWFMYYLLISLILLIFVKPPKFFTYLHFIALFFHIKSGHTQMIPETTVPILAITLMMRFTQMRAVADRDIYPIFLWLGAFSLFSSTFSYLSYIMIVTVVLFSNFKENKLKNLKVLSVTAFITFILFIFFPRFHQFLPSVRSIPEGEIGYSQVISNSDTADLKLSNKTAFYAELSRDLRPEQLYWRGRVHAKTDGYNWSHISPKQTGGIIPASNNTIEQKLKFEQDMGGDIILLDTPLRVLNTNLNVHQLGSTHEFRSSMASKKKYEITALSSLESSRIILGPNDLISYLRIPDRLPQELIAFTNKISAKDAPSIIRSFAELLETEQFSYTLSPGKLAKMEDFLEKKTGYCTHFASLLGMVLRIKKIPSRLVSGFQGGKLNEIGNFYEIKSNDAHAWVEYYYNQKWLRADPTAFISPDRVKLGGDEFLNPSFMKNIENGSNFLMSMFYKTSQAIQSINYKVGQLIDSYDRNYQMNIADKIRFKLKHFFWIGAVIIFLIVFFYYLSIRPHNEKKSFHLAEVYLEKLNQKLKKDNIFLKHDFPIALLKQKVSIHPEKQLLYEFLDNYQEFRYAKIDKSKKLLDILKKMNK